MQKKKKKKKKAFKIFLYSISVYLEKALRENHISVKWQNSSKNHKKLKIWEKGKNYLKKKKEKKRRRIKK